MKIAVVKYNAGNIYSVNYALKRLGVEATITSDKELLMSADKVIFPGVGEAETTMSHLRKNRLDEVIKNLKQPVLGICLGMQALFESSEEGPGVPGLGFFQGKVIYIPTKCKVPHVGWNHLHIKKSSPVEGEAEGKYVYFTHSYCCVPQDTSLISSVCEHGTEIVAGICRGNIFGVQYHPEKSSCVGMEMLHRFVTL